MVAQPAVAGFPGREKDIKKLVDEHRKLKDWPLILVIYFESREHPGDVHLFEVVSGLRSNWPAEARRPDERRLIEVIYGPTDGFPLPPRSHLHLTATSPEELRAAIALAWPGTADVLQAIRSDRYRIMLRAPEADELLELLRAKRSGRAVAAAGELYLLTHLRHKRRSGGPAALVKKTLDGAVRRDIAELCLLAPSHPDAAGLWPTNVEYPFHTKAGAWTAPCDQAAFSAGDCLRYSKLAARIAALAESALLAISRTP